MTVTLERTTTGTSPAPPAAAPPRPARLVLTPKTALAGQLDGAWWPRSRDLAAELPALVATLAEPWGRITRVTVNPTRWPVVPHKVPVAGHAVHVGWFTEQDPDKLILLSYTVGRWDLLVVPPQAAPAAAARLMAAAAVPGSVLTARALIAAETVIGRRPDLRNREDAWESEGGARRSDIGSLARQPVGPLSAGAWW
ncbi:DUF5994 family protein [Streptomyces sp. NBC_01443]|uniref:DUF5994 family protein n=1 Tax=Streptomyces sp. NBC_01443 TaxID=2903868 RepID=UPI0022500411|nr:DUF5994 family protein [Streptomyces sp. NBC_01443]MCX4631309.1 DUF5994 family protein [Streptomyces sp. NBC_01443]